MISPFNWVNLRFNVVNLKSIAYTLKKMFDNSLSWGLIFIFHIWVSAKINFFILNFL